jgi:hypothetical protein
VIELTGFIGHSKECSICCNEVWFPWENIKSVEKKISSGVKILAYYMGMCALVSF